MNVLQKAPNIVVVCATIIVCVALGGVVILIALGRNTNNLTAVIDTLLQGAGVLVGSGAFLYAGAAARSSSNAEGQLNGALDKKIQNALHTALMAHDVEVHGAQPTVPSPVLSQQQSTVESGTDAGQSG